MDIKDFQWEDLDLAPEETGIYAWYLNPVLRPADLTDLQSTKDNLFRLAEQLRLPNFDVEARGHLSLTLQGSLEHSHLAPSKSGDFSQLVESILRDDQKRRIFSKILGDAVPHLMAPLYIGVATSIRGRLREHRRDINYFRELLKSGGNAELIEDEKQKFALEIVKRGIPSRSLRVFISTDFQEKCDLDEIRRISEGVETILNRLFFPIMGRR